MDSSEIGSDIISEEDNYKHSAGPVHVFFEHVATYTFPLVCLPILALSVLQYGASSNRYFFIALIPLGWLAADFVTGLIHWFFDTYGSQSMPVLGASFIRPFREHHIDPKDITTHSLTVTIGNTCIAATPLTAWLLYPLLFGNPSDEYCLTAFFMALTIGGTVLTNQFHKWAHMDEPHAFIAFLQRANLILGPVHHKVHHTKPHDTYYCITNGWMDRFLDRINFWRGMEKFLGWFGMKPYPGIAHERSLSSSPPV